MSKGEITRREVLAGSVGIGAALIASGTDAQTTATARGGSKERAVDALFEKFRRPGSPGAAVGIYSDGKVVYTQGYGLADLENNRPNTPATIFHIASVSKQFCAFALAMLIERGRVDPAADIRKYLPFVPDTGATIHVEHLIHHTSGLRDHGSYWMLSGRDFQDWSRRQPFLNLIARSNQLNFAPGSSFQYTNTNYTLIAEIVQRVSGKTFRQFCAEHLFDPLGMKNSFFYDDVRGLVKNRAHSYSAVADGWGRAILSFEYVGATTLNTTIDDLMIWTDNLLGVPKVGGNAVRQRIMTPARLNDGTPIDYCYGLNRNIHNGRLCIMHNGADASFNTVTAYFPAEKLGIAVLQNTDGSRHESMITIARALADIYLDGRRIGEEEVPVPPELLAAATGDYLNPAYRIAHVEARDGALYLNWSKNPPIRLRHLGNGEFAETEALSGRYGFKRDAAGEIMGMIRHEQMLGGVNRQFTRTQAAVPSESALRELEGDYYNPEVETTWRISIEDGQLTARCLWSAAPIRFTPSSVDRFDSNTISHSVIEFTRDQSGRVTGLLIHTSRMNNVRLRKLDGDRPFGAIWAA